MSDAEDPVERRLDEHLELLRRDGPEPGTDLVRRVSRTARWQDALRGPLRVAGMIATAVVDGLGTLFGARQGRT